MFCVLRCFAARKVKPSTTALFMFPSSNGFAGNRCLSLFHVVLWLLVGESLSLWFYWSLIVVSPTCFFGCSFAVLSGWYLHSLQSSCTAWPSGQITPVSLQQSPSLVLQGVGTHLQIHIFRELVQLALSSESYASTKKTCPATKANVKATRTLPFTQQTANPLRTQPRSPTRVGPNG